MNKVIYEIYKNIKLLFRNWSSLALIVLAPLFLIMLVGYSFSGETLHDVNVGLIAETGADASEVIANLSDFAKVTLFDNVESCVFSMALEKTHICIKMEGDFTSTEDIPTGQVTFYYDNVRKVTSLSILSGIKEYFGLTSERISLVSTTKVIDNIQNLLVFLNERIEDIDDLKEEAENIKQNLTLRRAELVELNESFTPRYNAIKKLQQSMHNYTNTINNETKDMTITVYTILAATAEMRKLLNNSNITPGLNAALTNLENSLLHWQNLSNQNVMNINLFVKEVDSTVIELDAVNTYINNEIYRTDETIALIDSSSARITNISIEAKEKMGDLSKIDPSFASRLIRPITQSFVTLVSGASNVQLAFPVLLTTVIVFITLLFSNIISLSELRDKAYIRNILAPVNDLIYTAGLTLTNFIIIFLQVAVLMFVAETQFKLDIVSHLYSLIPVMVLLVLMFTFMGMLIAYISKSTETSILLSTFTALSFFMLSDSLNTLEIMPKLAYQIASLNPVVLVNSMFRKIIFSDITLSQISGDFLILILYTIAMAAILIIVSKKKNKERI